MVKVLVNDPGFTDSMYRFDLQLHHHLLNLWPSANLCFNFLIAKMDIIVIALSQRCFLMRIKKDHRYLVHSTCLINAIYYNHPVSPSSSLYPSPLLLMTSELNFSVPGNVLPSPLCLNHSYLGDMVQVLFLICPPGDSLQLLGHFVL